MQKEFNLAFFLPASPLPGSVRPVARGALHRNVFAGGMANIPHNYGKKTTWETKNVPSRNYPTVNVTNIVMQIRWGEESQPDMGWSGGVLVLAECRGRGRSQTVTFPW